MSWKVRFFQTARGDSPVEQFIKDQEESVHAKILHSILLLRTDGPFLRFPYNKKIQNNLYELRISGKNAIRIFYTVHTGVYYLIHAFKKKTQKTTVKELNVALDRMKEII